MSNNYLRAAVYCRDLRERYFLNIVITLQAIKAISLFWYISRNIIIIPGAKQKDQI